MLTIKGNNKRYLLITAGTICTGLGIVGIIIPVLPTTPFLLLAAICYVRSSQRMHKALLCNRILGSYIRNYIEGKGMTVKTKVLTLVLLWTTIGCTIAFATNNLIIRLILFAVVTGVTLHIALLRTPLVPITSLKGENNSNKENIL